MQAVNILIRLDVQFMIELASDVKNIFIIVPKSDLHGKLMEM